MEIQYIRVGDYFSFIFGGVSLFGGTFMTGETDFVKGAGILQETYPNIRVLNVTAGADGSYSFYGEEEPVFTFR